MHEFKLQFVFFNFVWYSTHAKNARDATRNGRDKMRERGRAAAAACVTTSVITNIPFKGEERLLSHEWKDVSRNQF